MVARNAEECELAGAQWDVKEGQKESGEPVQKKMTRDGKPRVRGQQDPAMAVPVVVQHQVFLRMDEKKTALRCMTKTLGRWWPHGLRWTLRAGEHMSLNFELSLASVEFDRQGIPSQDSWVPR